MGIFKLLIFIAVVWIGFRIFRALTPPRAGSAPSEDQQMVQCAHCGTHVPAADAIHHKDETFCSIEHRDEHR